jgi:hypothetical protein
MKSESPADLNRNSQAATLAKQASHLAQSGAQNMDAGELAQAAQAADREEAAADGFDDIANPIGRQIVEELRGVGAGATIPLVLALMAGDSRKVEVATQRLSETMGEDVSMTHGKVQVALDVLARQTQRYAESQGVDFHQFSDWAQRSHKDTAASVMVRHMSGNGKVGRDLGPLGPNVCEQQGTFVSLVNLPGSPPARRREVAKRLAAIEAKLD